MVVELPEQIVALVAAAVPPTGVGETVTVTSFVVADEQAPLVIKALYFVVALKVPVFNVVLVAPSIDVQLVPSSEDCH